MSDVLFKNARVYRNHAFEAADVLVCGGKIDGIGIDTWGVDFAYIGADGAILGLPRAYRDPYTVGKPEEYFKIVPQKEVYDKTGIQIMNFNSLYQLFAAKQEGYTPLEKADKILFMPDLLSYMLTGRQVCEYTDASTSQILNPARSHRHFVVAVA